MTRAVGALIVVSVLGALVSPAAARPVRVGRYTEIPYGIPDAHPYATAGADARRTGRTHVAAPSSVPSLAWETRLRAGRPSAPAITADGDLFLASAAGVTGVSAGGEISWNVRLGFVSGTPSLTPTGDLAVGTHAGAVVVLSADGRVQTRTLVGGAVRGSPLVLADGSMVVAAFDQAVHRFDADGRRIFRAPLPSQVAGPPVWTRGGELLVAAGDRVMFHTIRGDVRATVVLGATVVAGPAIAADGTVWVLTQDGALHQLSPQGSARTRTELNAPVTVATTIAVGRDGAVRVPTRGDAMVCVGPSGTERWRLSGHGGFLGGVTLDRDDVALAVNDQGLLLAIEPDGDVRWQVSTGTRTDMPPALGPDGTVYVSTVRGTLQAWR